MLTAFHARSIKELGPKDKSRQECILAYGDKLLVGLNNGTLRIYRVSNPTLHTDPIDIECLREVEYFSKWPIKQMGCIKESSIIVILADNYVSTYDMNTYEKMETLSKTKGATLFALTSGVERDIAGVPSVVSRLAVVVKRKVLLYLWKDGEFHDSNEINMPAQPRSLTWAAEGKLCAGLPSSFAMVDVNTEIVEDITMASGGGGGGGYLSWSTQAPLTVRLGEEELLLARSTHSMYISSKGEPIESKASISWGNAPEQLGYSYPFLVSLQPHHILQIRNPHTQTLLQSITLPGATLLHTPQHNHALSHAGKQFYLASPNQIWRMILVDYATQVKELTSKGEYDEAISLLGQLERALFGEKEEKIKEIQMLKAEKLFQQGKYRASMDLFAEVAAPPSRVIRLFPPIVAGELSGQPIPEEEAEAAIEEILGEEGNGTKEPEVESSANDNGDAEGKPSPSEEEVPKTPQKENGDHPQTPDGTSTPRTGYFSGISGKLKFSAAADNASIKSGKSAKAETEPIAPPPPASAPAAPPAKKDPVEIVLEGKALKMAVQELSSYLVEMHRKLLKFVKPDMDLDALGEQVQEKIPTFGEEPSQSTGVTDFGEVAALLPPSRHGEDASIRDQLEKLLEMAKLVDTTLLRSYMLTNTGLVKSLVRIENFCDPIVVHEKLVQTERFRELVDYLANKKLHKEALILLKNLGDREEPDEREPELHGPQPTVTYLQKLHADQLPLIFEYSTWVLHKNPKLGMQVFLEDSSQAESLPRHEVLDFLKEIDVALGVEYAEHLVHAKKDDSPDYHNWLIEGYLKKITEEVEDAGSQEWKWKLSSTEREEYAEKLLKFAEESQQYWPEKVIRWMPKDDPTFYEIRAAILSRLGEHRQALEIFVFRMQDYAKAEAYCNRVHELTPPSSDPAETYTETVYSILLKLYLAPPSNYETQIPPAIDLLSRHGARLDPLETLKLIPQTTKVTELENYFENRIRHSNSRVNLNRVMAQLYKAEAFRWEELNADAKNRSVVIGEERVCPVCHKRLGKSVISVFPDGQVVHYGCAGRLAGQKGMDVKDESPVGLRRGFGIGSSSPGGWR